MERIAQIVNKEAIIHVLKNVFDPEIGINIVDLGLVYKIGIDEEKKLIKITMTLTTAGCPMGEVIVDDVVTILTNSFTGYQPEIEMVWHPEWNYSMISTEGILYLEG